MSRTIKGKKGPGYEYWSRRKNSISSPGRISKNITKRLERIEDKKIERQALIDPENVRGRFSGE